MKPKKFLVTSALPYANASLHIGHIFESVITDIWVRFQVNHGNECHYFCASDAHGTPVMLKAEELGISPEQLIQNIQKEHLKSYSKYLINFSNFYSTHSDENKTFSEEIYQLAQNNGLIYKKEIEQFFDSEKLMFLSDRFIKGICPQCGAEDQYGDSCGVCGATYSPQDLVKPKSTLTNTAPILKTTEHIFFKLPEKTEFLKNFIKNLEIQTPVKNKLKEWTSNMLKDWDISRDSPYFGFKIPNEQDKYFYVWLDAPIGYFASIKDWANKHSFNLEDIINSDSEYELIHFIGKDISYFHALFWPALLDCTHYLQPSQINVHGFLTINGEKMSKSLGTGILADEFCKKYDGELLRYFFASKFNNTVDDIDFNEDDFIQKINSDIVGKYLNIASRVSKFIEENNSFLSDSIDKNLYDYLVSESNHVFKLYDAKQFSKAISHIMRLTDDVNKYINEKKPWKLEGDEKYQVASSAMNGFRVISKLLNPILPNLTKSSLKLFNDDNFLFKSIEKPILGNKINIYKPLMYRLDNGK